MTQYAIVTDLNRCVGCLACSSACKTANNVDIGTFWIKVLRVGPTMVDQTVRKGGTSCETYYLPMSCQHCENPSCVDVCPTGASYKNEDGIVLVDNDTCIGCGLCVDACPYGVRSINAETNVAEKCLLCADKVANGELPQCVAQCSGRARWFGDLDGDLGDFEGPADPTNHVFNEGKDYETVRAARVKLRDYVRDYEDIDVHSLPDLGTGPTTRFILRERTWQENGWESPYADNKGCDRPVQL